MKNLSWIALIMAALCVGILTAGCGVGEPNDITDVCSCGSCSHPYGACPGETLPNECPGESDGSQPCPCPNPGVTVTLLACPRVTYLCAPDGKWSAENDAACLVVDAADATSQEDPD
jgi:hypothetical protein